MGTSISNYYRMKRIRIYEFYGITEKPIGVNWDQPPSPAGLLPPSPVSCGSAESSRGFAACLGTCSSATLLGKLFLVSDLNLPGHILWPLLVVLPSATAEKSLAASSLLLSRLLYGTTIHSAASSSADKRRPVLLASCILCHLAPGPFW